MTTSAGWYPDPTGSGLLRWWDGNSWTAHFQDGQAGPGPAADGWQQQSAEKAFGMPVPEHGHQHSGDPASYRSPFTEQRFFVSQKRKLIEVTNEYAIFGADGAQVGAVAEVGQSTMKKAARVLGSWDQYLSHTVQVRDSSGSILLILTRPAKLFKSTMIVARPDGLEIGRIVQRNVWGKIRFGIESGGREIGSLNAENWRAWNFSIRDHGDTEIARITKKWEGLLTTMFTTADNYLVSLHYPLAEPMHSMVVAAALTIDTALKQDARGLG